MEGIKHSIKDRELKIIVQHITDNAMGNIIVFDSAPTLAQMKANTMGVYGTTLYVKFPDGTGISIAGVAMT